MTKRDRFVEIARAQVGKPYKHGAIGPNKFDCSGLVYYCYSQVYGPGLIPAGSHAQFNTGVVVKLKNARPGDLLFYDTMQGLEWQAGNFASHVGIYLGENEAVHALNEADDVKITRVDTDYWTSRFLGARDILGSGKDSSTVIEPDKTEIITAAAGTASSVGLTTPFRRVPMLPLTAWNQEFRDRQSSVPLHAIRECWFACEGWAVLLDQAIGETRLTDKDAIDKKNLLRLTQADGSTFRVFEAFWEPFAIKYKQLFDPGYKDGAYYQGTAGTPPGYDLSLAGYKVVYQGGPECLKTRGERCANGERYDPTKPMTGVSVVNDPNAPSINRSIAASMIRYDRWFGSTSTGTTSTTRPPSTTTTPLPSPPTTTTPEPSGGIVFGRVPRPTIINRIIPGSEAQNGVWVPVGQNSAWNDLGARNFRGVCYHIMEGTLDGTDRYFRNEARQSALTDFGIGRGTLGGRDDHWIYQWNTEASRRSPWANGKTDGLEGDGIAFVNRFGVNAVNRDLRSIEHAGFVNQVLNERIIQLSIELTAYLADQDRIRWDDWPYGPEGLILTYCHFEFARKSCPGQWFIDQIGRMIEAVGTRLRQYQTV